MVYRGGPQQQRGPGTSGNPAADYSEGASHVLAVIHEILAHHRAVEQRWSAKKLKLHQRLALRLFQEDVKQVCCGGGISVLIRWFQKIIVILETLYSEQISLCLR